MNPSLIGFCEIGSGNLDKMIQRLRTLAKTNLCPHVRQSYPHVHGLDFIGALDGPCQAAVDGVGETTSPVWQACEKANRRRLYVIAAKETRGRSTALIRLSVTIRSTNRSLLNVPNSRQVDFESIFDLPRPLCIGPIYDKAYKRFNHDIYSLDVEIGPSADLARVPVYITASVDDGGPRGKQYLRCLLGIAVARGDGRQQATPAPTNAVQQTEPEPPGEASEGSLAVAARVLIKNLESIRAGEQDARLYEQWVAGAFEVLFSPQLGPPTIQQRMDEGRKCVDILFKNEAQHGFFSRLMTSHQINCPFIFCECKNYSGDIKNPEIDQLVGRFGRTRGKFGILACRTVTNRKRVTRRCIDAVSDDRGYVLVLDDSDMVTLLNYKANGEDDKLNSFLGSRLDELLLRIDDGPGYE